MSISIRPLPVLHGKRITRLPLLAAFPLVFGVCLLPSVASATMKCPPPPEQVSKNVEIETGVKVATLGKLGTLELKNKTEIEVKDLFNKVPNADHVLVVSMLLNLFCQVIDQSSELSQNEKLDRFSVFTEQITRLMNPEAAQRPTEKKTGKKSSSKSPNKNSSRVRGNEYKANDKSENNDSKRIPTETDGRNATVPNSGTGNTTVITGDHVQINIDPNKEALFSSNLKLAMELGITQSALRNLLKKDIPADQLDFELRAYAERMKGLEAGARTYQSNDPEVKSLIDKSTDAIREGDFDRAEVLLSQATKLDMTAIETIKNADQARHLSVAHTESILGDLKMVQFFYLDAASHFQQAIALTPENSPLLKAEYHQRLAMAYTQADRFDDAERSAISELNFVKRVYGEEAEEWASPLITRGIINIGRRRYDEALPFLLNALDILKKSPGKESMRVALALTNIGGAYNLMHRLEEALKVLNQSLAIKVNPEDADSFVVAMTLTTLGAVYTDMGRFADAKDALTEALRIKEKVLGVNSPALFTTLVNLGLLHYRQMQCDEGEPYYKRAIPLAKVIKGENSETVKNLESQMKSCGSVTIIIR